jgi:stage V sporulation protein G
MKKGFYFMQITDIRIRDVRSGGKMKAIVSITFDDVFVVHDIKIIQGKEDNLFVGMPSRKTAEGDFRDVAHPINTGFREELQKQILERYKEFLVEQPKEETLSV